MVLLHYTGMESGEAALARLCDPIAKVSAHYVVEEDGRVFILVPEDQRAWHAGVSFWAGDRDINGLSIGVEIVNPGHEWGYRAFPERQISAVIDLLDDIRGRWTIPDGRILGHSDVAPDRKMDPGEFFPWERLAGRGHGIWAAPAICAGENLKVGDDGAAVAQLQSELAVLGYEQLANGRFDSATAARVVAFQRHWVQSRVDGVADGTTFARVRALNSWSRKPRL